MDLTKITRGCVKSVAELIDLCEQLQGNAFEIRSGQWAYRGQPEEFGVLRPSFERKFSQQSYGTAELIENKLMEAFREHYKDLPDRSPDMPQPAQISEGHDMRCLSVMQHYEIPTRLLDWTTDFWTAVYFACSSEPDKTAELWYYRRSIFEKQRNADPSLWALVDPSPNAAPEPSLRNRRWDSIVVEVDPRISPRMREQHAHHTVSTSIFSDHAPVLIELGKSTQAEEPNSPEPIQRCLIDGACKGRVLQFLAEPPLKVTASTIFPDVVGLGRFLRWQFDSLRTMLL